MKTIDQHAADVAKVIDAIKAIPPSPPKVREWVDRDGDRWRLIDGRIEFYFRNIKKWVPSLHGSLDGMLLVGREFGIREVTDANTGESK